MPHIRLQAIEGQDHLALLLEPRFEPFLIGDTQGHQFLIAMHQMGHAAQGDGDPTRLQGLMHFGHTAVLAKAPLANQGNDVQAKFTMRQRPAPFFFGSVGLMDSGDSQAGHIGELPGSISTCPDSVVTVRWP